MNTTSLISGRMSRRMACVATFLLFCGSSAFAQINTVKRSSITYRTAPTVDADKWALVIAVDRNRGTGDGELSAVDGAKRFASVLTATYGYRNDHVVTLTGGGANFKQVIRSIQDMSSSIPRSASLIVYVSANGATGPYGDAYAVPDDGNINEKWTLLPVSDIAGLARQNRSSMVVTDNCALGSGLVAESRRGSDLGVLQEAQQKQYVTNPMVQAQQAQIERRLESPDRAAQPALQDFDVVSLCPASERPIQLTRSLSLREDMRRSAKLVAGFLQGIQGRADVTADGSISAQDVVAFMESVGEPLNGDVQHAASSGVPFVLIPQTDTRYDGLRRLSMSEVATTDERQTALKSLAELVSSHEADEFRDDFGSVLQEILASSNYPAELRATALDALGPKTLSYEWSIDAARNIAQSDSDSILRVKALQAISRLDQPESAGFIREALTNKDPAVRSTALDLVSRARDTDSASLVAELARGDSVSSVRTAAIAALPDVQPDPKLTAAALIPLLNDPNTFVRVQVMNALVKGSATPATGALGEVLQDHSQQTYVRQSAAYALGKMVVPETRDQIVEVLTSVLGRDESRSVREAALFSLGQIGTGPHESHMTNIALESGEDLAVRIAAVQAMGATASTTFLNPLMTLVDGADAPLRLKVAAIEAIGEMGDPAGARYLYNVMDYGNPDLKNAAAEAIGRIRVAEDPDLVMRLVSLLGDPNYDVRESTIRSLSELTDDQSFDILVSQINDKQSLTRRGIVDVLGRQQLERGFEPILPLIVDPSFDVRIAAYEALGKLEGLDEGRDEKRHGVLLDGAYDREPAVRRAAMTAVRTIIASQAYDGQLDASRHLAQEAVERVTDDAAATAWLELFLLPNSVQQPTVGVSLNSSYQEESAGPGWTSVELREGNGVVTTYGNRTANDLLVTSFALAADGQIDLSFLARWLPAGDQIDVNGEANVSDSGTILRTFTMSEGDWATSRPELDSPSRLRDYLTRAVRAGALHSAGIVTIRVVPRPANDYRQMMKR